MKHSKHIIPATLMTIGLAITGLNQAHAGDDDRPNRPLDVIASGEIKVDVNVEISLADGAFFDPIALAPDIYYGINEDIAVGLIHSKAAQGVMGVADSLAIGNDNVYNNVGLEGHYTFLRNGTLSLAAQAGFYALDFSPDFNASLKVGAIARAQLGPIEATVNPYIFLPLNDSGPRDNIVSVPVWFYYNIDSQLDLAVITGMNDEELQLGGGVSYDLSGPIDLGAHVGWPAITQAADVLAMRLYASIEL